MNSPFVECTYPNRCAVQASGGYRKQIASRKSDVIYRGTVVFCRRFMTDSDEAFAGRMIETARRCLACLTDGEPHPGNDAGGELAVLENARDRLSELISDYQTHLALTGFSVWSSGDERFVAARTYSHSHNDWSDWQEIFESRPAEALANLMLTICHQSRFLLDKHIEAHGRRAEEATVTSIHVVPIRDPMERDLYAFLSSSANPGMLSDKIDLLKRDIARISRNLRRKHGWIV